MKRKIAYLYSLIQKHGMMGLLIKFIEKKTEPTDRYYRAHYKEFLPKEETLKKQRNSWQAFSYCPKISIVVPTYRTPERFLRELLESVLAQSYENWELCIADGSCDKGESVGRIVNEFVQSDSRIVYKALEENGGISKNTNEGFLLASGEYIALLDHDDLLSPDALYVVVERINQAKEMPLLLYSDEDKIDGENQQHFEPHFKTGFNEELLNHYNYICHFLVFHKSLLAQVKGLDSAFDGTQDYDFVLRCSENIKKCQIAHIDRILYHWRVHSLSTAGFSGNKDYAYEAAKRAVQAHLDRMTKQKNAVLVKSVKGREYVSVDRSGYLEQIEEKDWVACVGAHVRPIDKDWSKQLAISGIGLDAKIGMIGGKLITGRGPFGKVISVGFGYGEGLFAWMKGYYRRAVVAQNVSACSLDFCVIKKEALDFIGGFKEVNEASDKDVEVARRLEAAGYKILVNPSVVATCKKRFIKQKVAGEIREGDPFYNENIRGYGHL